MEVQRGCGCVIGRDYPHRIVDHDAARSDNMEKMKFAYDEGTNIIK